MLAGVTAVRTCGNARGHAGPTWTHTIPGYFSWVHAAGYALVDRKKQKTLLPVEMGNAVLVVTCNKRHHSMGGRLSCSTQRNCAQCATSVYPGSFRCSTEAGLPASEGKSDLLAISIYLPISILLLKQFHYVISSHVFLTEIWKEPCAPSGAEHPPRWQVWPGTPLMQLQLCCQKSVGTYQRWNEFVFVSTLLVKTL